MFGRKKNSTVLIEVFPDNVLIHEEDDRQRNAVIRRYEMGWGFTIYRPDGKLKIGGAMTEEDALQEALRVVDEERSA